MLKNTKYFNLFYRSSFGFPFLFRFSHKPNWFPGLVVHPRSGEHRGVPTKDHLLVRSFKDSKFHCILQRDVKEYNRDYGSK